MTIIDSDDIICINGMFMGFFFLLFMFYVTFKQFYPNKSYYSNDIFEKFVFLLVIPVGCSLVFRMVCFILNILY
jgi:hypothetical protein